MNGPHLENQVTARLALLELEHEQFIPDWIKGQLDYPRAPLDVSHSYTHVCVRQPIPARRIVSRSCSSIMPTRKIVSEHASLDDIEAFSAYDQRR